MTFSDPNAVDKVLANGTHELDGKKVRAYNFQATMKPRSIIVHHYYAIFVWCSKYNCHFVYTFTFGPTALEPETFCAFSTWFEVFDQEKCSMCDVA